MTDHSHTDLIDATTGSRNPDSMSSDSHRHPIGAGIGAILAASTAGATGGVLVGPVGALVGAVVGAVAGGFGGQALAELIDPAGLIDSSCDTYTSRTHCHIDPVEDEEFPEDSSIPESKQATREAWSRLDQSSKDLLADTPLHSDE